MNSFGRIFRINIFGESHGESIGIVVDGCPPGLNLSPSDFTDDLNRRRGGTFGTTKRVEGDLPTFKSGIFENKTTGSPITIIFDNKDFKSDDYNFVTEIPRPGHADFTARMKYDGFNDYRGGGHLSGRLTLAIVAAGVIAKKIIKPVIINSKIISIGGSTNIKEAVKKAIRRNDSIGGVVECTASKIQVGLGEPFFDSLESMLSHAIFSIPAIKAIEFGIGFNGEKLYGSEFNDPFIQKDGTSKTNNNGGINGGITNGNDLVFRVFVKPTPSILAPQKTLNFKTNKISKLVIKGRHDPCIALRVPVVLEAATAIVLADFLMLNRINSFMCN